MASRSIAVLLLSVGVFSTSCLRSPAGYVIKGNELYQRGKFEEASLNYRKAIRADPKLAEAYYRLALSLLKENKPEDVLANLTRAVDLSPDNSGAKEQLADLLLTLYLNKPSRPKDWYDQLVRLSSDLIQKNPNSYAGHRIQGYLAFLESKPDDALAHFQRAAHVKPELAMMIAQSLFLAGHREQGEQQARAVIDSDPDYAAAYDFLALLLRATQRYAECEALLKLKMRNNPKQPAYAVQLADFYQQRGEFPQRDAVLTEVLRNSKAFPDGAVLVGDFDNRIGEWKSALEAFRNGLQAHPERAVEFQTRISSILVNHGEALTALNQVEQALSGREDSGLKVLRASLVIEARQTPRLPQAIADLLEAEKKFPQDGSLHFQTGRAYVLQGKLSEGQRELREAVKLDGGSLEPRLALVQLSLSTGQYYDALRQCDEILSAVPGHRGATVFRAASLSGLGRHQEAHAALTTVLAKPGDNSDVAVELGFLTLVEKNYAEAERIFREHYRPGAENLRPLAGLVAALQRQGKTDAAVALVQKDLSAGPDRPFASLMLAQVTAEKDPDQARQQLERLVAAKPQFSPALLALGELDIRRNQPQLAIVPLERARALNPTSSTPLLLLSGALERAHEPAKAQQVYAEWLKIEPDNPTALNNLAFLQCETGGDLDQALQLARHALDKSPKDANISDTIGWIYLKKQMYSSAGTVFRQISQQHPGNAGFRFHNALAYLASGEKAKAKTELQAALAVKPSPEIEGKIRETLGQLQAKR